VSTSRESSLNEAPLGEAPATIVALANQKGGVGKSTTAINLAAALAFQGQRVLIVDLDPQGNATSGLGVDRSAITHSVYDVLLKDIPIEDAIEPTSVKNLFVVPATIDLAGAEIELVPAFSREGRLKAALATITADFRVIFIDCPPSGAAYRQCADGCRRGPHPDPVRVLRPGGFEPAFEQCRIGQKAAQSRFEG
jgi:cellulose biosynthesis protein BcsQ